MLLNLLTKWRWLYPCIVISTYFSNASLIYTSPRELYRFLNKTVARHPDVCSLFELGKSSEGRPIPGLKIQKGDNGRFQVVIEFGVHAREWATHFSAIYVIDKLVKENELITDVHWYIIPLLNPDGFLYSKQKDRMWRKNRRRLSNCTGVDINRNFPVGWRHKDEGKCAEDYAGPHPFSENESIAINKFMKSHENEIDSYISVHSCAQSIIYPYAYTRKKPRTHQHLFNVARKIVKAMNQAGLPKYKIFQASTLYEAGGSVFDWLYDFCHVPLVYTMELPFAGKRFVVSPREVPIIAKQCFAGLRACAEYLMTSSHKSSSLEISFVSPYSLPVFLVALSQLLVK